MLPRARAQDRDQPHAPSAVSGAGPSHHLYVHVPFCRLVCAYCDFVTVAGRRADIPRYVDALMAELRLRQPSGTLRTIYFGGGTPSLLSASDVARLTEAAREHWGDVVLDEVTLEANPGRREAPQWAALRGAGVDRISLGAQSLRDQDLRALGRGHTAAEVRESYAAARDAGFENVSIDLIYDLPGQSLPDWADVLDSALELAPDHVSLYALSLALEPDGWAAPPRRGALRWRRRMAAAQDEDRAVAQYRLAEERLAAEGLEHYELSSWARPGRQSRHNAAYWARRPYTGIGAGSHSFDGRARSWNVRALDRYLATADAGQRPLEGEESLDDATRAWEAIALGLRRVGGFSRAGFRAEFGVDPVAHHRVAVEEARAAGLLEVDAQVLRLSPRGRLVASEVVAAFLPAR